MAYTTGSLAEQLRPGEVLETCRHCGQTFGVSRWERWRGFIIGCPYCHGTNGRHWSFRFVLYSGLLLNALSFFLFMRPRDAFVLLLPYACGFWIWGYLLNRDLLSQTGYLWFAGALFLSPVLVNALVLIHHERALDEKPILQSHSD